MGNVTLQIKAVLPATPPPPANHNTYKRHNTCHTPPDHSTRYPELTGKRDHDHVGGLTLPHGTEQANLAHGRGLTGVGQCFRGTTEKRSPRKRPTTINNLTSTPERTIVFLFAFPFCFFARSPGRGSGAARTAIPLPPHTGEAALRGGKARCWSRTESRKVPSARACCLPSYPTPASSYPG